MAVEGLMGLLYPDGHPYGRRTKGVVAAVDATTRGDLVAYHRTQFSPEHLMVVIVGDVSAARAITAAERVFGDWHPPSATPLVLPPLGPAAHRQRLVMPMMNKAQADVAYGFVTVTRRDPDYHALTLMNNVLGQYGLGGRLGDSIRERQGMAYYAFSSFDGNVAEGPLVIRAGVAPENVDRTVASIDEEVRTIVRDGVTASELADAKRYLIGSMPRNLETNSGIASFLHTAEFFGLGLDYDHRLPGAARRRDARRGARGDAADSRPGSRVGGDRRPVRSRDAPRRSLTCVTRAVFFDVDFTLIHPGPTFRGEGYHRFCARHGIEVDPSRFEAAVAAASAVLDEARDPIYEAALFHRYTAAIITGMGGVGPQVDACAEEIYDEWAGCHHFELYDDVPETLRELAGRGIRIGLISNSHRCLASFQSHFELERLISAAVSSAEHGYMKPHPSIFDAALRLVGVPSEDAVMVGDSLTHDVEGAMQVGMRGVLVRRSAEIGPGRAASAAAVRADVPVIRSLTELPALL